MSPWLCPCRGCGETILHTLRATNSTATLQYKVLSPHVVHLHYFAQVTVHIIIDTSNVPLSPFEPN